MRILHVITTINRGGAENHVVDLAVAQADRGADVAIAYLKGDGYWAKRLSTAGVRVEPLGLKRYGAIAPFFALRRLFRDYAPDLIHAHLPPAELYTRAALLPSGSGQPLLITKHNDEPFYPGPGHDVVCRWVMQRACRAIAISNAVNRYSRDHIQLADNKLRTVCYGIDCGPFETVDASARQTLHAEWGIKNGEMVIGTVARLVPQKALHALLTAFGRYKSISKRQPRLVIVGRGPLMEELKDQAERLTLSNSIVWTGFREDIPAIMHAFDVFSLTSAYEGLASFFWKPWQRAGRWLPPLSVRSLKSCKMGKPACCVHRTTQERSQRPSFGWRMLIFARFWAATDAAGCESILRSTASPTRRWRSTGNVSLEPRMYWVGNVAKSRIIGEILDAHPATTITILDCGCGDGGDWRRVLADRPDIRMAIWLWRAW